MADPNLTPDVYQIDKSPVAQIDVWHYSMGTSGPAAFVGTGPYQRNDLKISWTNIKQYSYDSDILVCPNQFAVTISNPDGSMVGTVRRGDPVYLYIKDPGVAGGNPIPKLKGIITEVEWISDNRQGSQILIKGADLGWHLAKNNGPLWKRYAKNTYQSFLNQLIGQDPAWGFGNAIVDNYIANNRLKMSGQRIAASLASGLTNALPPIQFEPGESMLDVAIAYARYVGRLIDVGAEGDLHMFLPANTSQISDTNYKTFVLNYYKATNSARVKNNVLSARVRDSLEGVYTQVTCVGQVPQPAAFQTRTVYTPNEGKIRSDFFDVSQLSYSRYLAFGDGNQISKDMVKTRANWKWRRGQFDSWSAEYVVPGHYQQLNGSPVFYEPDNFVEIHDEVNGVDGIYYLSGCKYDRSFQTGTRTTLTIHKPNLLSG